MACSPVGSPDVTALDRRATEDALAARAHRLSEDLDTNPSDLEMLLEIAREATVVGIGATTRTAHELTVQQSRVAMFLVEQLGFRSIVLEEDWTLCLELDQYVRGCRDQLESTLMGARPFWRTKELLGFLKRIRARNDANPFDLVRIAGLNADRTGTAAYDAIAAHVRAVAPDRLIELETLLCPLSPTRPIAEHVAWYQRQEDKRILLEGARRAHDLVIGLPRAPGHELATRHARAILDFYEYYTRSRADILSYATPRMAENLIWWHRHTGHHIVYWGGIAHTARGDHRLLSNVPADSPNVGALLRRHFGTGYCSGGFMFRHGSVPQPIPFATEDFAEAVLGSVALDAYLLDCRLEPESATEAWLAAPAKIRTIGPDYDPAHDAAFHMSGGSLSDWFDFIVHSDAVTPLSSLHGRPVSGW